MFLLTILLCLVREAVSAKEEVLFDYTFPVHTTERCPLNSSDWIAASDRLHCNDTHGYHCVPDKTFSFLIEFCYPEGKRKRFQKGNCLELAYTGILNHVKCRNFTFGCPDEDYNSDELYRYPACLNIYENCFTADTHCLKMRCSRKEQRALEQGREDGCTYTGYIVGLCVISVLCISFFIVNIILLYKNRQLIQKMKRNLSYEVNPLLGGRMNTASENKRLDHLNMEDDIGRYIFVDFTVEDAQLFDLLKRQCLNGVYVGFKYLVESKVIPRKKNEIFHQHDAHGCTLLHYAAQGGSITIIEKILTTDPEAKLQNESYRGQNALHFAIKYKQKELSEYLITQHGKKFIKKSMVEFDHSKVKEDRKIASNGTGEFEPFHWIAWNGDLRILEVLKEADVDLTRLTRNGLGILDIACMKKENDFCRHVIENEKQINLEKVDSSGWNISHYAAMSDNVEVLKLLKNKHEHLIKAKTHWNKTTLHIACEYGCRSIVTYLIGHFQSLLKSKDDHGWNAAHYAAKGGNLEILKELLKTKRIEIDSLTEEGKTLLHIACIHKQVEICNFVAERFSQDPNWGLLDLKTTNHGWTAAHYLGVESKGDGSEAEIIDMLHERKMKLSATTNKGYSILTIAIDHLNTRLTKHILSNKYRAILEITEKSIRKDREHTKNEQVLKILDDALSEIISDK
ncbi:serine/threonine-protein phosphatase 6 regulatory ankyrin repeat subunit A-like isoform X2 [Saccostrea echinata]|nr:serine/threonine-protein phosphatase 6 regulatory ankyrin repeat subunit A-like isoform X2 [Saccostrea echinata]